MPSPTSPVRMHRVARAALWLHGALYMVLLAAVLSGCSAIKGVVITENERRACESIGCTVWTEQELDALARHFFKKGYEVGVKSI